MSTGAPWVLLRGLSREARHWADFPGLLQRALGEPVITLDLPGNGQFAGMASPADVHAMARFVRAQWQQRGLGASCSVLGLSLGGMVATDWAQIWPHELDRLVLVNTSMRPFGRLTERLRPACWPTLASLIARWRDAEAAERLIHGLTCQRTDSRASDIAAWALFRQSAPVLFADAWRQLRAAARFACGPTPPACPTLVVSSTHDRLVHPGCSARLADAWHAPHAQHPWAGHDLPHDDPGWLAERIALWTGANPSTGHSP